MNCLQVKSPYCSYHCQGSSHAPFSSWHGMGQEDLKFSDYYCNNLPTLSMPVCFPAALMAQMMASFTV